MLSQFQASYQRVEQSLQRLTDSIAAYNPSVTAADELLVANEEVDHDLEKRREYGRMYVAGIADARAVVTHQTNHVRLQQLRQQTTSLDQKIKDTVKLIADLRRDIQAIPSDTSTTDTADPRREVSVDELLRYAKFISKTAPTVPRKPVLEAKPPSLPPEGGQAHITNGIATPPPGAQDDSDPTSTRAEIVGLNAVPQTGQMYVAPPPEVGNMGFEPWPSHGQVQLSALADIQKMVEAGRDPGSVLTPEQREAAEKARKEEEERGRLEEEEKRQKQRASGHGGNTQNSETFDVDDL